MLNMKITSIQEIVIALFSISIIIEIIPNNRIQIWKIWSHLRRWLMRPIKEEIEKVQNVVMETTKRLDLADEKIKESIRQRIRDNIIEYNEDELAGLHKSEVQYRNILEQYDLYEKKLNGNSYASNIMDDIKKRHEKKIKETHKKEKRKKSEYE